jgi:arylsulfatase A-like enzyme
MMHAPFFIRFCVMVCICAGVCSAQPAAQPEAKPRQVLLIVLDGLRPDYVTTRFMPRLLGLSNQGVVAKNHHSVFPTVTRVNASSFVTGCYPHKHGLLGNTVYFPEIDPVSGLSTGNAATLEKIQQQTGGKLLLAPSLGEILKGAGKQIMVFSSGSTGSAQLLDHTLSGAGIVNVDMIKPDELAKFATRLGAVPPDAKPATARNKYIVDAYFKLGSEKAKPALSIMWITDPDHTAHDFGTGTPKTIEALQSVDAEIGRLLDEMRRRHMLETTNIIVTSDHGFSTHVGEAKQGQSVSLVELLIEKGLKASKDSDDVVVSEGAIYVKNHDLSTISKIVQALQLTPWVGAIFTRGKEPGSLEGAIPGTLSFDQVYWDSPRSGDILVSANWTAAANKSGFKGMSMQSGVAGHGSSSPFDIHNTLIVAGPDFKSAPEGKPVLESNLPTCNVDLAPTILALLGIDPPEGMDGRVLSELFKSTPTPKDPLVVKRIEAVQATVDEFTYKLEVHASNYEGHRYIDMTRVIRTGGAGLKPRDKDATEEVPEPEPVQNPEWENVAPK